MLMGKCQGTASGFYIPVVDTAFDPKSMSCVTQNERVIVHKQESATTSSTMIY
jgi:hypothetical protein